MNFQFLNVLASLGIVGCTLGIFRTVASEDPAATVFILVIGAFCWIAYFHTRDDSH